MIIVSLTFLDSCQQKKDYTILRNTTTFLKFPTYEELCKMSEPEITSVVAFSISVQNNSDSILTIIGDSPLMFPRSRTKSTFFLIYDKNILLLSLRDEVLIEANESSGNIELLLDLTNRFQPDCIDKIEYNSLRDSIYTIAREGILLYVPNEEDFEEYEERRKVEYEYSQGKYRFLKKPILIGRDSTKVVYKSYLPPEGIDASVL